MKRVILFITFLLSGLSVYAAPFRCDMAGGVVFADKNQCDRACAGETGQKACEELEPAAGGGACDMGKYRGFVAVNGKTFALTNTPVPWNAENTAKIRDANDNKIAAKLLKIFGVQNAWIGAEDRKRSTAYNNIDKSRFVWRDNSLLTYSNWLAGQPDNAFDAASIGLSPVYGEHWAAINQDGYWLDLGRNTDGSLRQLPALAEFKGELSCVSGRVETTSGAVNAGSGVSCLHIKDEVPIFEKCIGGPVFGSGNPGWLCPEGITSCVETKEKKVKVNKYSRSVTLSGAMPGISTSLSVSFNNLGGALQVYVLYDNGVSHEQYDYPLNGPLVSADLYVGYSGGSLAVPPGESVFVESHGAEVSFTIVYSAEEEYEETVQTCPYSGQPCVESEGSYYCSPNECSEVSDASNFETNSSETPQGFNDADNNGPTDADGNCLGRLVIFPGNDRRCRMVGLQTKNFQCCKIIDIEDIDKSDIIIFHDVLEFDVCNGSERSLAVQRSKNQCVSIGKYCSEKWTTGLCVQKKETFCCFDSDFARAFNEAGMDMLGKSWGIPESPNCGGFSPEELQELSAMNISDHPKMRQYADQLGSEFSGKLMNEFNKNFQTPELQEDIKEQIEELKQ